MFFPYPASTVLLTCCDSNLLFYYVHMLESFNLPLVSQEFSRFASGEGSSLHTQLDLAAAVPLYSALLFHQIQCLSLCFGKPEVWPATSLSSFSF